MKRKRIYIPVDIDDEDILKGKYNIEVIIKKVKLEIDGTIKKIGDKFKSLRNNFMFIAHKVVHKDKWIDMINKNTANRRLKNLFRETLVIADNAWVLYIAENEVSPETNFDTGLPLHTMIISVAENVPYVTSPSFISLGEYNMALDLYKFAIEFVRMNFVGKKYILMRPYSSKLIMLLNRLDFGEYFAGTTQLHDKLKRKDKLDDINRKISQSKLPPIFKHEEKLYLREGVDIFSFELSPNMDLAIMALVKSVWFLLKC